MRRHAGQVGRETLCVLGASVLWGTTGTAATFAPAAGPLAIGAAAMGLGGLAQALTAARLIMRQRAALHAQRRIVLLGGAAVAVYPLAFYTSMRLAGVAVGTVVSIGSAPLASALAERATGQHRLTARWMTGTALGLAGIVCLCLAEATRHHPGHTDAGTTMLGVCLGLAAGATYALYTWAAHRLIGRGVTPRAAMGATFGAGGLLLLPVLLATGAPLTASWANAAVGAYMALIPMFTGYLLFGWALARIPASTATTLSLLEPAIATILAVLVVGEHLPAAGWAGLALIGGCLVILSAPRAAFPPARFMHAISGPQKAVPQTNQPQPAASTPPARRAPAPSEAHLVGRSQPLPRTGRPMAKMSAQRQGSRAENSQVSSLRS